jgi:RNA polymerase sigma factor (sigma-70 family)
MAEESDQILLRAYFRGHCEASFGELVHRHIDLVHSTAWRILRDRALAEDVTQRVFLAVAQYSAQLQERTSLTGWLHETARNLAINTVRSEERRRHREQEAAAMNQPEHNDLENLWERIVPCLDETLARLSASERDVILWRYFEQRTAEQIGSRLGLSAEAAQKRVARALERLRGILAERDCVTTTASLVAFLSTQAVQSAPAGLAASAIAAAGAAGTLIPTTSTLQILMASTKMKIGIAAVLAAGVTTPLVLQQQTNNRLRDEIAQLRNELAAKPPAQIVTSDTSELDQLRGELLRLRNQVGQLRQQLAEQAKAVTNAINEDRKRADNRGAFEMENARTLLAKSPEIPMIPVKDFKNVGNRTALDSFHTMNGAAANRDTNAVFNAVGLEPQARARAEELFAQMPEAIRQRYGTVDALLVDWRMNMSDPVEAYLVLSQREEGPDAAILTVQFQYPNSRVRESELSYYRDEQGNWRAALPAKVMEKLPHVFSGQQQATAGK